MGKVKNHNRSKYWSKVNKDVFDLIKVKKVAYLRELELSLESKYGSYDVGKSVEFLSKKAPIIHLVSQKEKINGSEYRFLYRKKEKQALINIVLKEKKKLLERFNPVIFKSGNWSHQEFYPRVLKNVGFIVEHVGTKKYNLVEIKGDIDIILTPIPLSNSKIFIEIKNRLSFYSKEDLYNFFNYLRAFNLNIIPVVIARRIFENPKEILLEYGGKYIEMGKLLVKSSTRNNALSKDYNKIIANITRIIPENVIPPDIIKKINVLKKLDNGINFSSHSIFNP